MCFVTLSPTTNTDGCATPRGGGATLVPTVICHATRDYITKTQRQQHKTVEKQTVLDHAAR